MIKTSAGRKVMAKMMNENGNKTSKPGSEKWHEGKKKMIMGALKARLK